jgi:xylan 1,4-beta-xylosidase
MAGRQIEVTGNHTVPLDVMLKDGVRGESDVSALACLDSRKLSVLLWHYHDDDLPGPEAVVELRITGLPPASRRGECQQFRVDEDHSNAFSAWRRMGSPRQPTPEQYIQLEKAGRLASVPPPPDAKMEDGKVALRLPLPRQAVSLLEWTW